MTATTVSNSAHAGELILKNALVQPFKQLMLNAGLNAEEKLAKVLEHAAGGHGFDVHAAGKLQDMKAAGIVDPAKSPARRCRTPCRSPAWP